MSDTSSEKIIISLGGSMMIPEEIDTDFIKQFKELICEEVKKDKQFFIITGGGKVCRKYQAAAQELIELANEDLDWIGIYTTRMNAEFMRFVFKGYSYNEIVTDPRVVEDITDSVVIGAGWKPGWSTDYDAVEMAETVGAHKIINLSNIDYVYDKDPKQYEDAEKVENISWADYRKLLPKEWDPGLNTPFDPIASKKAEEAEIEVAIMNGKPLTALRDYLKTGEFKGTLIS